MSSEAVDESPTLRHLLLDDHAVLLRLFDEVLRKFAEDDRSVTAMAWSTFESALSAHLVAEEALIFPQFRNVDPVECQILANDDALFRRALDTLGIAVDLHTIRSEEASEFIEILKLHAAREEGFMYVWAQNHLRDDTQLELTKRLTHRNL